MIDIFDAVVSEVKAILPDVDVREESAKRPAALPCVTIQETGNVLTRIDSAQREKYAAVTYRVRVYSSADTGRRQEAAAIFQTVDQWFTSSNFIRKSVTRTPDLYHSTVYCITATYEAEVDGNRHIYTRS